MKQLSQWIHVSAANRGYPNVVLAGYLVGMGALALFVFFLRTTLG